MSFLRSSSSPVMVDSEPDRRPVSPARPLSASTTTTTTTTTTTSSSSSSSFVADDLLAHLSSAEDLLLKSHAEEAAKEKAEKKTQTPPTTKKHQKEEEDASTGPSSSSPTGVPPPKARPSSSSRRGVFTREEVAAHNTAESCWLIVGNDVYDVTPFLASHPAGRAPLLRRAGGDATRDFHFHSRTAQRSWGQYKIGVLEGSSSSMCLLM